MYRLVALVLAAALSLHAQHRFRVLFGGSDSTAVDWSGRIEAEGGSAAIIGPYHFGVGETHDESSWAAGNQWDGNINLLPQESARFPATRWKGVVVDVDGPDSTVVHLRTAQGNARFRVGTVRYQRPESLLDGRIRIERSPRAALVDESLEAEDQPVMTTGPDGRVWVAWIASENGSERIRVRSTIGESGWSAPVDVTPEGGDYHQLALISTEPNAILVVWSATVDGAVDLYSRTYRSGGWTEIEQLTSTAGPDVFPRMAAASSSQVYLVWQSVGRARSDISLRLRQNGEWTREQKVTEHLPAIGSLRSRSIRGAKRRSLGTATATATTTSFSDAGQTANSDLLSA